MAATLCFFYHWSHHDVCRLTWRQACFYYDELSNLLGQNGQEDELEIPGGMLER